MSRRIAVLVLLGLALFASGAVMAAEPADLPKDELTRLGTDVTALVDFTGYSGRFASALCVHPSGLFVTNAEPFVRPGATFDVVRLVIRPGRPDQSVHDAAVLCRLADTGLTLLRVDGATGLVAPPLATPDAIDELMDVAAFDVPAPPGRDWDAKRVYPPVRAGMGSISAIQRQGGRLFRIQFDAPLSPGSTGGPLLDTKGRVLSVVLGRARAGAGEGVGLAVPADRLDQFLNHAEVTLTPPDVNAENLSRPVLFRARAKTFFPSKAPLEVGLILGGLPTGERQFPMTPKDGAYEATAEPLSAPLAPRPIRLEAMYDDGTVSARVEDRTVTIDGARAVRLGEIRLLRPRPRAVALLGNGTTLEGLAVSGLGEVAATVGSQTFPLDLAHAQKIAVKPPEEFPAIACSVVARRDGRELGRESTLIYAADRVSPCLEALRDGRFIRPARGDSPATYLTFEGGAKATPGPGPSVAFGEGGFRVALAEHGNYAVVDRRAGLVQGVRRTNTRRGIIVESAPRGTADRWEFCFEAPQSRDLNAGDYPDARGMDVSGVAPEIKFDPPAGLKGYEWVGDQNVGNSGRFVVWEIEVEGDRVTCLAIDFTGRCRAVSGIHPVKPFYGMIRFKSTFQ
jgi:hypothetical protein